MWAEPGGGCFDDAGTGSPRNRTPALWREPAMAKAARQIIAQVVVRCGHGSLPICGEGNKLKSLITDRDIVGKVITAAKDPRAVRVGEPARGGVVTGGAGDSAEEMLATMRRHQVRRLPVI